MLNKKYAVMKDLGNHKVELVQGGFNTQQEASDFIRKNLGEGHIVAELGESIVGTPYKDVCKEYYKDCVLGEIKYYNILALLIKEADSMRTRRCRLRRLHDLNSKLVDGYLVYTYGKTYDELFE